MSLKTLLKRAPIVGPWLVRLRQALAQRHFRSDAYWEERYRGGGNSGAGSYDRLAIFKAQVLNDFCDRHRVETVIEFGCGDGNQLSLARYRNYTGVDVSPTAVALCRRRFADDPSRSFMLLPAYAGQQADLALSLDVIYHLVEDAVFEEYMRRLFGAARRFVVIYSSNYDSDAVAHVRHRRFEDWICTSQPEWSLQERIPNAYPYDEAQPDSTSLADFYCYVRNDVS
jgi:SAM-dependent methyltransferase